MSEIAKVDAEQPEKCGKGRLKLTFALCLTGDLLMLGNDDRNPMLMQADEEPSTLVESSRGLRSFPRRRHFSNELRDAKKRRLS
jgi:hypothetical protein